MAWKKRRRYPMTGWSYLCFTCGFIFLSGNLYMLHTGFIQQYEVDRGGGLDRPPPGFRGPDILDQPHFSVNGLPLNLLVDLRVWDRSEIPGGKSLNDPSQSQLRKLMENHRDKENPLNMSQVRSRIPQEFTNQIKELRTSPLVTVPLSKLSRTLQANSNCTVLQNNLTDQEFLASGWTKAVYRATLNQRPIAVKTVDIGGHDMSQCAQRYSLDSAQCYVMSSQKILKELLLLQGLKHPNVVKVFGYCLPDKPYDGQADSLVTMATELGESIDIIKLLQLSWEERLRISFGLTRLLAFLADSPYGSVALNDFRRQQFVLVSGDVKITDLDDVSFEEPVCHSHTDCQQYFSSANFTLRTSCVRNTCEGHNEKKNIFNAGRHFTTFLLPHGAPPVLRPYIDVIVEGFSNATMRAGDLLKHMTQVVDLYKSGQYLQRTKGQTQTEYECEPESDLPGQFDYRCRYTVASSSCTVSAHDLREAEDLCTADTSCQGFVVSKHRTWAGRMIIHLKNNVTTLSRNPETSFCQRPRGAV